MKTQVFVAFYDTRIHYEDSSLDTNVRLILTAFDNEADFLKFKEIDPEHIRCEKFCVEERGHSNAPAIDLEKVYMPDPDSWAWNCALRAGLPAVKYLESRRSMGI